MAWQRPGVRPKSSAFTMRSGPVISGAEPIRPVPRGAGLSPAGAAPSGCRSPAHPAPRILGASARHSARIPWIVRPRRQRRDAARAGEVVEADLHDAETHAVGTRQQLDVDEGALALELDGVEHAAAHQLAREVDVADAQAEREPDQEVVDGRVERAPEPLAAPVEPVAAQHVGLVRAHDAHEPPGLAEVEGQVGVGVEHEVAGGGTETRTGPRRPARGCARGARP